MTDSGEKNDHAERQEIVKLIDDLIDIDEQIAAHFHDENKKMQLIDSASQLYFTLNSRFPSIQAVLELSFPHDNSMSRSYPDWRKMVAYQLENSFPLSQVSSTELSNALRALNDGEVKDALKPTKNSQRIQTWSIRRLQLLAVMHTYLLRGAGTKANVARDRVATAYGYFQHDGGNTVRKWEQRELKKYFAPVFVDEWKEVCRQLGEIGLNFESENTLDRDLARTVANAPGLILEDQLSIVLTGLYLRDFTLDEAGQLYLRAIKGESVSIPPFLGSGEKPPK